MFYIIDKPALVTSFDLIRKLRKLTGIKKMGHIGTLDPFATGIMVIAAGKSTKLIPLLEGSRKEYIFTVRLDGKSESLDTETPIEKVSLENYKEHSKEEIVSFLLEQKEQIPPRYSAIHIDGKRAYELARGGKDFDMKPRGITVYEAEVREKSRESLTIRIVISSGGYVRSFAPLLGEFFGIHGGGYLSGLRRSAILSNYGNISLDMCSEIEKGILSTYTYSRIFPTIPTIKISEENMKDLKDGKDLTRSKLGIGAQVYGYIFLSEKSTQYSSLCSLMGEEIKIIKNDICDM